MLIRATAVLIALAAIASAQPVDPYAPTPAPTPAPKPQPQPQPSPSPSPAQQAPLDPYAGGPDSVLAEQVAEQLVARAEQLLDAKIYADAKQLAVEALVESPHGNAAEHAKYIIKMANLQLGIKEPSEEAPPQEAPPPKQEPPPPERPPETPPAPIATDGKIAAMIHGALYGGILGAAIGGFFDTNHTAAGAVPTGIAFGIGGGLAAPFVARKLRWKEEQVRTAGSLTTWSGVVGATFGDAALGESLGHGTPRGTMVGGAIGATIGLVGGGLYASRDPLSRGDVALVDTFAGMGAVGGITLGLLMQPAQNEAYALNAGLGAAAGVIVGLVAAPKTNTTPRRMLRVAGLAAAGAALPMIIFAASTSSGAQQAVGALSSLGMVAGAWTGFYLTRNMDVGLDVKDRRADAPPVAPPPPQQLGPQPTMTLPLFRGAF